VATGPAGIAVKGGEGDGITPRGSFPVREIFYRADRIAPPRTQLPVRRIEKDDGWCDAPDDPNYNRLVKLPYPASAENMWRDDPLYDLLAVLGYNDDPVVPGKGSAIFLHLARSDYSATHGCVALAPDDLRAAIEQLRPGDQVVID
jgi:L,D-peptidoglycan transpeptidase YkuD (ErfK/YbiS/YcfS/YnhG family)